MLRVLGPLEITTDEGQVAVHGTKPRTLLAALAIERGGVASPDALIDAIWGENPPASAPKLLQIYVSRLRKVLPKDIQIRTIATGYALDTAETDADRFERLQTEGRAVLRGSNPALASSILGRALALWRGPAYADVRYEAFAEVEIERLERLRQLALEARIEADLRLGRHEEVLAELHGLLAADPTNEVIAAQAMLASYRTNGQAAAAAVYETVRDSLRDELDSEPGEDLVALRARIESRDPTLAHDADSPEDSPVASLPVPPTPMIGREHELAELRALLLRGDVRFVSLAGAGGSGKSRLALELARDLAPSFANGAVLIELAGLRDPDLVLGTIARAFGLEPGGDTLATLAEQLAGREALLVIDNIEHLRAAAVDLVKLLAAAPRLAIVVTTRVVLHVSGEHVYPVGPLLEDDAIRLFVARAQAQDPAFAPDEITLPMIARICRRLDGLPLPIELAAAQTRALGVHTLDSRLASRLTALDAGVRDLPARQQTLRETLAWSIHLLEPEHQDVLAALAVFPASCPLDGAVAVAGADDGSVIALVDHSLLQVAAAAGEPRYRLLETVREYAFDILGPRRPAVDAALVAWMLDVIGAVIPESTKPLPSEALDRLDAEIDTLREALRIAAAEEDPMHELVLASAAWKFWWVRGYLVEGRGVLDEILARRGIVATRAGVRAARGAASLAWSMGDDKRAGEVAAAGLAVAVEIGDVVEQMSAHNLLGAVARRQATLDAAESHFSEAVRLAEAADNLELVNMYRMNLGTVHLDAGRLDDARRIFEAVLEYRRDEDRSQGLGVVRLNLGQVLFEQGELDAAEEQFIAASEVLEAVGFKGRLANALQGAAAIEARTGRADRAARRLGQAAAIIGDTGWGLGDSPLEAAAVEAAREQLGDATFERLFREGLAAGA